MCCMDCRTGSGILDDDDVVVAVDDVNEDDGELIFAAGTLSMLDHSHRTGQRQQQPDDQRVTRGPMDCIQRQRLLLTSETTEKYCDRMDLIQGVHDDVEELQQQLPQHEDGKRSWMQQPTAGRNDSVTVVADDGDVAAAVVAVGQLRRPQRQQQPLPNTKNPS